MQRRIKIFYKNIYDQSLSMSFFDLSNLENYHILNFPVVLFLSDLIYPSFDDVYRDITYNDFLEHFSVRNQTERNNPGSIIGIEFNKHEFLSAYMDFWDKMQNQCKCNRERYITWAPEQGRRPPPLFIE